jgi:hypothetical protein
VALSRGDGAIVEATVKPEVFARWLEEPRQIARRTR